MKLCLKDVLAALIGLAALAGLYVMWTSEPNAVSTYQAYQTDVLPGLKKYAGAMGAILLAVSISYILLGRENDIETRADENK